MNGEQKYLTNIIGIIAVGALLFSLIMTTYSYSKTKVHVMAGYEKTMVIGHNYPVWKKVK